MDVHELMESIYNWCIHALMIITYTIFLSSGHFQPLPPFHSNAINAFLRPRHAVSCDCRNAIGSVDIPVDITEWCPESSDPLSEGSW